MASASCKARLLLPCRVLTSPSKLITLVDIVGVQDPLFKPLLIFAEVLSMQMESSLLGIVSSCVMVLISLHPLWCRMVLSLTATYWTMLSLSKVKCLVWSIHWPLKLESLLLHCVSLLLPSAMFALSQVSVWSSTLATLPV